MTRIRISHSWRTIRGARIRIVHRRKVAVESVASVLRSAYQGMATFGDERPTTEVKVSPAS
ncbi:hypothetical protein ACVWZ4_004451 [Bradyrhizobium sp. USDA 4472]